MTNEFCVNTTGSSIENWAQIHDNFNNCTFPRVIYTVLVKIMLTLMDYFK